MNVILILIIIFVEVLTSMNFQNDKIMKLCIDFCIIYNIWQDIKDTYIRCKIVE